MKRRLMTAALLMWVAMFVAVSSISAQEEEVQAAPQEIEEAQETAQRFESRMLQTRDVAALFDELFLPNFISHFMSSDCECIPLSLYSQLSEDKRIRWFVAVNNISYLITLDVLHGPSRNPEDDKYLDSTFKRILPDKLAKQLQKLIPQESDFQITDYQAFQSTLISLEKILAKARVHLIRQGIEQTSEFQKELRDKVTNTDIGYRVRAYVGGENVKDCEPLIGFPANQKFYRVETPLMMGVILVKDGEQMKIVRLTIVDGD